MSQALIEEDIAIPVDPATPPMGACLARPAGPGRYPIVIVCGEMFGLNAHLRDMTRRIAALGYLALAPDFYHRTMPGAVLGYDEAGRQQGFALLGRMRRDEVLADLDAAIGLLRRRPDAAGETGIVGFSLGGHIAYLAATQLPLRVAVCLYGGWLTGTDIPLSQPEPTVTLTPGIAAAGGRLLYLVGERDHAVTQDQTEILARALAGAGVQHELVIYPGIGHGFFCDDRPATFHAPTRDDAWGRIRQALADELSPDTGG